MRQAEVVSELVREHAHGEVAVVPHVLAAHLGDARDAAEAAGGHADREGDDDVLPGRVVHVRRGFRLGAPGVERVRAGKPQLVPGTPGIVTGAAITTPWNEISP